MVRLKKTMNGELIQGCDTYIGRKVSNARWDLPQSIWGMPFFPNSEEGMEKWLKLYEDRIRTDEHLWKSLDTLEGRTLGCWCKPGACHGDILVRLLEEKKCNEIKQVLSSAGLNMLDERDIMKIRKARKWAKNPIWLAHATRLDSSDIFYFEPQTFDFLARELPAPDKWVVYTETNKQYYVVGQFNGCQPLGPFCVPEEESTVERRLVFDVEEGEIVKGRDGDEDLQKLSLCELLTRFGKVVTPLLKERFLEFHQALCQGEDYLRLHRAMAQQVGYSLGIDMADHDLSKTRLVQVALAYCWHWAGWGGEQDPALKRLAMAVIRKGHCELEDHHPEFQAAGHGLLDIHKLFADRIAVHLQKDSRDSCGGWGVKPCFIPEDYKMAWEAFVAAYGHIDLYAEAYDNAISQMYW